MAGVLGFMCYYASKSCLSLQASSEEGISLKRWSTFATWAATTWVKHGNCNLEVMKFSLLAKCLRIESMASGCQQPKSAALEYYVDSVVLKETTGPRG